MFTISKNDRYLYSVSKSGVHGVLFQFDVTDQSMPLAKQYIETELFDIKAFTSGSIVNGVVGTYSVTMPGYVLISLFCMEFHFNFGQKWKYNTV